MTTLKYGSTGNDVKTLQTALNRADCSLTVDGVFGSRTTSAVKTIQKKYGLTQDGIVGPATWKVLEPFLVSDADFAKAFRACLDDMEKLPSVQRFMELMSDV